MALNGLLCADVPLRYTLTHSVFSGFLYLVLVLLLVIWSYSSALHARTIVVCISEYSVPLSPFDLNPV